MESVDVLQVVDAYALIGDVTGLAEKIQSFFMQEVISETHTALKSIVLEVHLLPVTWISFEKSFGPQITPINI